MPGFDRPSLKTKSNYFILPLLWLLPINIRQSLRLSEKAPVRHESWKTWSCFPLVSLPSFSAMSYVKSYLFDTLHFFFFRWSEKKTFPANTSGKYQGYFHSKDFTLWYHVTGGSVSVKGLIQLSGPQHRKSNMRQKKNTCLFHKMKCVYIHIKVTHRYGQDKLWWYLSLDFSYSYLL